MTTYADTEPGPQCATGSRPIERRGLKGQCDGCYGWHPLGISPTRGWWIRPHKSTPAQGDKCPGNSCTTVYDPPRYSNQFPPLCERCLEAMPDDHDEFGRPYKLVDGEQQYLDEAVGG